MTRSTPATALASLALAGVGLLGLYLIRDQPTPAKPPPVHITHTVTKSVAPPTVTATVTKTTPIPANCIDAYHDLLALYHSADLVLKKASRASDLMEDLQGELVAGGNGYELRKQIMELLLEARAESAASYQQLQSIQSRLKECDS